MSVSGGDLRARDAMVTEPLSLDGAATAQEAGEAMIRPEVRAVFVLDGGRLLGVITRKTLVREVVAAGRNPRTTPLREIAEVPVATVEPEMLLAAAFHMLEERDLERVPVVDNGTLVGVLARGIVQRRLAEDEPPDETDGEA